MKLTKLNVTKTLKEARLLLEKEKDVSPTLRAMFLLLLTLVELFAERLWLNSNNSSKPPSSDLNRQKKQKAAKKRKPGGQLGHKGTNLKPVDHPDNIIPIHLDKRTLPRGHYQDAGYEARQVVELEISRVVTEYRAQVLEDDTGKRWVAPFPDGVSRPIQYGQSVKSHSVYLSQFQLMPYDRMSDYFAHEAGMPLSVGSLVNFNREAFDKLETFEALVKEKLIASSLLHADETGINVNGKRVWLHCAVNAHWTHFYPHEKRGTQAMDEIAILPNFKGILVHDHWQSYYKYTDCQHSLCNAHHIRELEWVIEHYPDYTWAKGMQALLCELNHTVDKARKHQLSRVKTTLYQQRYRKLIKLGEAQMPLPPPDPNQPKRRGRQKKSKSRNLLERLRDFEADVLRFISVDYVPFTNNAGENAIRMTKVQQKISGCFRSWEGAEIFCRVRSYLLTAQKHDISPTDALQILFQGKLPEAFYAE